MTGFAAWLAGFRLRRVALIAGLFPLPLVSLMSAAIVVFTAEIKGGQEAFKDVAFALLALLLIELVAGGGQGSVWFLGGAALTLGFSGVLGTVLHKFRSLTLAVQLAVLIVAVGLLVFQILIPDPQAFWLDFIERVTVQLTEQGFTGWETIPDEELANAMTLAIVISMTLAGLLALLLGSLLSCRLRGESFAARFQALKLGVIVGGVAAISGLGALLGLALARDVLLVISIAFVFQGIAVVAAHVSRKGWQPGWFGYVVAPLMVMVFVPVLAVFIGLGLAATGFIDNWYSLRPQQGSGVV